MAAGGADVPEPRHVAVKRQQHRDHYGEDAAGGDEELHHVGPDHGLHAPQHRVERDDQPAKNDRRADIQAGDHPQRQGLGVDGHGEMTAAEEEEQPRSARSGRYAESLLQILIDGVQPQPGHEGHEQQDHHHQGQRNTEQLPQHELQIVLIDQGRDADVGDGRNVAGHDGDARRPPGHGSLRQEVVLQVALTARVAQPDV